MCVRISHTERFSRASCRNKFLPKLEEHGGEKSHSAVLLHSIKGPAKPKRTAMFNKLGSKGAKCVFEFHTQRVLVGYPAEILTKTRSAGWRKVTQRSAAALPQRSGQTKKNGDV